MNAGRLRHRVDIEQVTESQSASGQVTRSWSRLETIWAAITRTGGNEYVDSQRQGAEATHRVECRFVSGVTAKMRVKFGDRVFNILSVENTLERGIDLVMMTKEAV